LNVDGYISESNGLSYYPVGFSNYYITQLTANHWSQVFAASGGPGEEECYESPNGKYVCIEVLETTPGRFRARVEHN